MSWIIFAYSLPKNKSSVRVALWRRLQRLGAIAPAGNLYVLPAHDECVESFQWLTQEIQSADGQAITFHSEQIDGMTEQALIGLFCAARAKDYDALLTDLTQLDASADVDTLQPTIAKLRRQFADIQRIDYFDCPEGSVVATRLSQLERALLGEDAIIPTIAPLELADFQNKVWVTRPQPHVDRLSSIWLIRRFIDANATIRYSHDVAEGEISFDMPNAQFSHTGSLCTFETLRETFQLAAPGLTKVAEIVHEIDLHDGIYNHPETVGLDLLLKGWLAQQLSDTALEERGLALFDGLLAAITA